MNYLDEFLAMPAGETVPPPGQPNKPSVDTPPPPTEEKD